MNPKWRNSVSYGINDGLFSRLLVSEHQSPVSITATEPIWAGYIVLYVFSYGGIEIDVYKVLRTELNWKGKCDVHSFTWRRHVLDHVTVDCMVSPTVSWRGHMVSCDVTLEVPADEDIELNCWVHVLIHGLGDFALLCVGSRARARLCLSIVK